MSKKNNNNNRKNNNSKFKVTKKKTSIFEIFMIGLMILAAVTMALTMFLQN